MQGRKEKPEREEGKGRTAPGLVERSEERKLNQGS
jgi:hypothetical protein